MQTVAEAARFLKAVKFALRYGDTPGLPLRSLYAESPDQRTAIKLTNALLASAQGIETNLIAGRLVIAHRDIVPALIALRVRFRAQALSSDAGRALKLISENEGVNSGAVRKLLGGGTKRPDRADRALAELMRELLIDRGPSSVPKAGIPYLSKEAYPYRAFEAAHPELIERSRKLTIPRAIAAVIEPFPGVPRRKLASLLKLLVRKDELPA
jgi:hypothetical protein